MAISILFTFPSSALAQNNQPPARPTGLTTAVTRSAVTLTWNEPSDDSITSYRIFRRSKDRDVYGDGLGAPEFDVIEDNTGSADTNYVDKSVAPHTRYVYRVKARNERGLSPISSYANAETLAAPAAPSDTCADTWIAPTPTAVTVDAVPIVVDSTPGDYFVLYARHELGANNTMELPVVMERGEAGTTTLTESVEGPASRAIQG